MAERSALQFSGERIVPQADNCEPNFASRMYQEHIARYLFASQLTKDKHVLDIGCGVGYGSQFLAQRGAASVCAFDISEEAVNHGNIYYAHPNLKLSVGNAEDFAFDNQFDVAVSFELIEHVHQAEKVLQCIHRALKPGGILVMSTPRALENLRTHHHTREFSLEEFEDLIRKFFPKVEMYVENNHFASLVTRRAPSSISLIECLKDQFTLAKADVFVVVASSGDVSLPELPPTVAFDDDAYVTMLERDVQILHRAEDELKVEAARLRVMAADAEARRLDAFECARNAGDRADGLQRELDALRRDLHEVISPTGALRASGSEHREIVEAMQRVFGGTIATHYLARDPIVDQVSIRISELKQELIDQSVMAGDWHAQIMSVRRSKSWRWTKPFRAFDKFVKKLRRRKK